MNKLEELVTENLRTLKRMAELVGSPKEVLAKMELEIQLMKNKDSRSLHLSLMHHKYATRLFNKDFCFEEQDILSLLAEITKAQRLTSKEKTPDDLLIDILNAALDKGIISTSKAAQLAGVNLIEFRRLSNANNIEKLDSGEVKEQDFNFNCAEACHGYGSDDCICVHPNEEEPSGCECLRCGAIYQHTYITMFCDKCNGCLDYTY